MRTPAVLALLTAGAASIRVLAGDRAAYGRRGVYDPGILKAVFLAGGPGSGKSYVAKSMFNLGDASFSPLGLKLVNSDPLFELLLKREGFDPADLATMDEAMYKRITEAPTGPRMRGKALSDARTKRWLDGRLGLVVDGTGRKYDKIARARAKLEDLGYDTAMVFVNTSLPVALERNRKRSRKLPDAQVRTHWSVVQANLGKFQRLFGRRQFYLVDNNRPVPVDRDVIRAVSRFASSPVRNRRGRQWINAELRRRRR
jgi:chloramphenicol 3-O-phosphotransferase